MVHAALFQVRRVKVLSCACEQAKEREHGAPEDAGRLAAARRAAEEREAELRRAMRDGEAKLRERIARLDDDNQDLRRCTPLTSPYDT